MRKIEKILQLILIFLLLLFFVRLTEFAFRYSVGKILAKQSKPFSFSPAGKPSFRVLIAGDSIAVGTGAPLPEDSIAGRIHRDFKDAEIINLAEDGRKIKEVLEDLNGVSSRFDIVIIHAGGNDILFLSDFESTMLWAEELFSRAKELSDTVLFLTSGDIGLAPILPKPIGWFYSYRTKEFLDSFKEVAKEEGIFFIDFYRQKEGDKFLEEMPIFAADLLHLNEYGYEIWYQKILEGLKKNGLSVFR